MEKLSRKRERKRERKKERQNPSLTRAFWGCVSKRLLLPQGTQRNALSSNRELCRNRRNLYLKIRNCRTNTPYLSGTADNYSHLVGILTQKSGLAVIRNCRCAASTQNKTANHFDFARISVRHQKTADIELVVRKEDSTSNRRLSSLNFNLSLSLSLSLSLGLSWVLSQHI